MFSSQPYIIKGPRSDNHVCDWITVKMITSIIMDIQEYSLLLHWPHKYTMLIAYPLATYMTSHKSQLHHSFPVGTDQIPSLLPPQFVQRLIASGMASCPPPRPSRVWPPWWLWWRGWWYCWHGIPCRYLLHILHSTRILLCFVCVFINLQTVLSQFLWPFFEAYTTQFQIRVCLTVCQNSC